MPKQLSEQLLCHCARRREAGQGTSSTDGDLPFPAELHKSFFQSRPGRGGRHSDSHIRKKTARQMLCKQLQKWQLCTQRCHAGSFWRRAIAASALPKYSGICGIPARPKIPPAKSVQTQLAQAPVPHDAQLGRQFSWSEVRQQPSI